jgi:hypothetical protein
MSTQNGIVPPFLRTERLTLTLYDVSKLEHHDLALGTMNNPTAYASMGDYGLRTHEDMKKLAKNVLIRDLKYHGVPVEVEHLLMVVHLGDENGPMIGIVSLCERSPHIPPDIGWGFLEPYMGKGYATEAAKEFLRFVMEDFGIKEIICWPDPKNKASNRIAEKLGFVEGGALINSDHGGELAPVLILPGMDRFDGTKSISFGGEGGAE